MPGSYMSSKKRSDSSGMSMKKTAGGKKTMWGGDSGKNSVQKYNSTQERGGAKRKWVAMVSGKKALEA